jgi:hypothetical protein
MEKASIHAGSRAALPALPLLSETSTAAAGDELNGSATYTLASVLRASTAKRGRRATRENESILSPAPGRMTNASHHDGTPLASQDARV